MIAHSPQFDVVLACGGKAKRMKNAGLAVPDGKSWLAVSGEVALRRSLRNLAGAQHLQNIILVDDNAERGARAAQVARDILGGSRVHLIVDPGHGLHGLPSVARQLIGTRRFYLLPGHGLCDAVHLDHMARIQGNVTSWVHSVFDPTTRTKIAADLPVFNVWGRATNMQASQGFVTLPYLLTTGYFSAVVRHHFQIETVIEADPMAWSTVTLDGPVEADYPEEWLAARRYAAVRRVLTLEANQSTEGTAIQL